ncbi:dUTP diphosphatase [Candidatus Woesearchaeota archaeon]|nr:dUTP diphosphatase [Candidatus Woesearchaeota archaeon]
MVELKIERIYKDVKLPSYSYEHDAALDLPSAEECVLAPGEKKVIKTGLRFAIPRGHVGLIWDRSGLAAKNSIHTLAGVIDSGYRGEIGVVLINLGKEDFKIEKNMRIAQILIQPVVHANITEAKLDLKTERSEGGFGSSGLK